MRRLVTYLVMNGFSLLELRKLYADELYEYHDSLIYMKEQVGELKEGSYDKIRRSKGAEVPVDDTINQLRKQLRKIGR